MTDTQKLYETFQHLAARRSVLENTWRACYAYALPQREGLFSGSFSQTDHLYDGTAPDSVDQVSASMFSELTPPWTQWFDLMTGTEVAPEEADIVAQHLQKVSEVIRSHLDRSSFGVEVHQCFLDLVTVGTACLLFEENKVGAKSAFKFTAVPLAEVYIDEGPSGRPDTTFRRCQLTAGQIAARFNKGQIKGADIKDSKDRLFSIIECVVPRDNGGYDYTVFVENDTDHVFGASDFPVLKTGYFENSPFITFRWQKTPGEIYGRSPVMKALPDIKTANKVVELILKNATIAVTGIWQAEDDGVLNPANIRLVPGAIIPKAVGSKGLTPLEAAGNFDVSQLVLEDLRARIRHALLADKLGQVESPQMTATEVLERTAEMVRVLGATYGRLQSELLHPLIERAVYILRRRGEIPEIYLDGRLADVHYKSPIARMQAEQEARNALTWLNQLAPLGQEALGYLNGPAFARWLASRLGVPADLLNTETAAC